MKIGNYTFSLKNFEYLASRSDETNCFGAILCVNGKLFAQCGNSGQGGPTDVHIFPEYRELGKEIEEFLRTQPKAKIERYDLELDVDLEFIVDELVQQLLLARQERKIKALTKTNLVFKTPYEHYQQHGWKKQTIESMLKHPQGPDAIRKVIAEELAKGNTLVNENIPAELLP
jgi:hypothetical protein